MPTGSVAKAMRNRVARLLCRGDPIEKLIIPASRLVESLDARDERESLYWCAFMDRLPDPCAPRPAGGRAARCKRAGYLVWAILMDFVNTLGPPIARDTCLKEASAMSCSFDRRRKRTFDALTVLQELYHEKGKDWPRVINGNERLHLVHGLLRVLRFASGQPEGAFSVRTPPQYVPPTTAPGGHDAGCPAPGSGECAREGAGHSEDRLVVREDQSSVVPCATPAALAGRASEGARSRARQVHDKG